MSEPLAERLSRFTPDGSGLDRDALLFAAGRASARPGRRWKAVAGVLAASQLLTLVFLWPRTPVAVPSVSPTPPVAIEPSSPSAAPADPGSWTMNLRILNALDDLPPPTASDSLVPDDPPLRASSPLAAILN
jgi:hypothetical protein